MFPDIINRFSDFTRVFAQANYELYLVGGAVRNLLLGKSPKDWDMTTNAHPETVQTLFKRVIPTGIKHGTVTVIWKNESIEVTTFRTESEYSDHRRPLKVDFNGGLKEDLERRDFTINAMALNLKDGTLIDHHGGMADLENKHIRAIGRAIDRFQEDALRILRAPRFACQLGFSLDNEIVKAAIETKDLLKFLSPERKREELKKIFESPTPSTALRFFRESELWENLFPDGLGEMILGTLDETAPEFSLLRWVLFFNEIPIETAFNWFKSMTFTNKEIQEITSFLNLGLKTPSWQKDEIGPYLCLNSLGGFPLSFLKTFLEGLYKIKPEKYFPENLSSWVTKLEKVLQSGIPLQIKDLPLNGNDLMSLGINGRTVGQALQHLLQENWVKGEVLSKDDLIKIVKKNFM